MGRIVVTSLVLAAVVAASGAARDGGRLDPTFDDDGIVATDLGGSEGAAGVALQRDGKLVVVGGRMSIGDAGWPVGEAWPLMLRYRSDGSLDPSFDGDGIAEPTSRHAGYFYAVAVQPDGKIVGAGGAAGDVLVVRLLRDGSLDPTFGGGVVTSDWGDRDVALAIALQPDGKVVVAGKSGVSSRGDGEALAIARLNPDGSRDVSFGGGLVRIQTNAEYERFHGVAIQRDARILAVGIRDDLPAPRFGTMLAQFTREGALDSTFGEGGIVADALASGAASAGSVAVDREGRIVVAGCTMPAFGPAQLVLARRLRDGRLDAAFASGGVVRIAGGGCATDIEIDSHERLVVGGSAGGATEDLMVMRLLPNGSVDRTFARGVSDVRGTDKGNAMVVQRDGKPVLVGTSYESDWDADLTVVRYLTSTCVVPRLERQTLARAKASLDRAACALGRVSTVRSTAVAPGRVVSQRPPSGAVLPDRAPISLVLSRGRR